MTLYSMNSPIPAKIEIVEITILLFFIFLYLGANEWPLAVLWYVWIKYLMFGNICSYTPHCVEKVPKMPKNGKKSQNKVTIFVITLINFLKTLSMTINFILVYVLDLSRNI